MVLKRVNVICLNGLWLIVTLYWWVEMWKKRIELNEIDPYMYGPV
jgi:hypothetical protein